MSEFIQTNSALILALFGGFGACGAACLRFILKSRCEEIKICGIYIKRDVIPAEQIEFSSAPSQNQV